MLIPSAVSSLHQALTPVCWPIGWHRPSPTHRALGLSASSTAKSQLPKSPSSTATDSISFGLLLPLTRIAQFYIYTSVSLPLLILPAEEITPSSSTHPASGTDILIVLIHRCVLIVWQSGFSQLFLYFFVKTVPRRRTLQLLSLM